MLGCSAPQAGGQTGDENDGGECSEIRSISVSRDTAGPGGFSAAESSMQLDSDYETSVEFSSGMWSNDYGAELGASLAARVSVEAAPDSWRVVDYARPNSDETGMECPSRLNGTVQIAVFVEEQILLGPIDTELTLDSASNSWFAVTLKLETLAETARRALRTLDDDDRLTLVGGVTALGSWGRLSLVDGAGVAPNALLLGWPRKAICGNGGVPVRATDAERYLALPSPLTVTAETAGGDAIKQEWRIATDAESACFAPARSETEVDALVVDGLLEIRDVETDAETTLPALLRVPTADKAQPSFELTAVGPCASIGSPHPESFAKSCGDWFVDPSGYEGAHLELGARVSTEERLDGQVRIFGDTPADCVDTEPSKPDDETQTSFGSCTGTESELLGSLTLDGMLSE